jgi:hypothetical protein
VIQRTSKSRYQIPVSEDIPIEVIPQIRHCGPAPITDSPDLHAAGDPQTPPHYRPNLTI